MLLLVVVYGSENSDSRGSSIAIDLHIYLISSLLFFLLYVTRVMVNKAVKKNLRCKERLWKVLLARVYFTAYHVAQHYLYSFA